MTQLIVTEIPKDLKVCSKCKHFDGGDCIRDKKYVIDFVLERHKTIDIKRCEDERNTKPVVNSNYCGHDGQFFVKREELKNV